MVKNRTVQLIFQTIYCTLALRCLGVIGLGQFFAIAHGCFLLYDKFIMYIR